MLIKSCIAHLWHLPGFDQVGHSPPENQWGGHLEGGSGGIRVAESVHFLWLFRMGSHWWHRSTKSSLLELAVLNGGRGSPSEGTSSVNLNSFLVLLLPHRVLLFLYIEKKDQKDVTTLSPRLQWILLRIYQYRVRIINKCDPGLFIAE